MSDVSGNDLNTFEEESSEVLSNEEESSEVFTSESEGADYESENSGIIAVDYSSNFEAIQNSISINNALLLACILLIGLLMGLKNER